MKHGLGKSVAAAEPDLAAAHDPKPFGKLRHPSRLQGWEGALVHFTLPDWRKAHIGPVV